MRHLFLVSITILLLGTDTGARGQWVQTNGPYVTSSGSTDVGGFAVPGESVFAATADGVYRTTDDGDHWFAASTGLPYHSLARSLLSLDTNLFVGTYTSGVYQSSDKGSSWHAWNSGIEQTEIHQLFNIGNSLIVRTGYQKLFITKDGGAIWQPLIISPTDTNVLSLAVNGNLLYAGCDSNLFRTSDMGGHWDRLRSWSDTSYISALYTHGSLLFTEVFGPWRRQATLYRSKDSGATFTPTSTGLPPAQPCSAFASIGNKLFAATNRYGVFLTINEGESWVDVGSTGYAYIASLAVHDGYLFEGSGRDNAGAWRRPLNEMSTVEGARNSVRSLLTIYPNPSSQSTLFNFESDSRRFFKLELFDMTGGKISTIFEGWQNAGMHSIRFEIGQLSSGIYQILLTSSESTARVMMSVVK